MSLPTGTILGSYEILQQIGAGGMGEVYRANDRRLARQVALKFLPAQFSGQEEFRQRFEREAQLIAGLNHPHICTLYDVGKQDGMNFLVMELLEGETLAARLERGPIPLEEALRIALQIAGALDKAHTMGVTHRDLKPSNIMLTKSGAKLMDFGLAKRGEAMETSGTTLPTGVDDLTQRGSIVGTVQYMAPEQIEGEEADARTDIFAFGLILYEMVTGKKAFTGKSHASLMASILHHTPAPMSVLQPVTPPSLQRVVEICMAKDRSERWRSAHDVMLQLKWIAEGGSAAGVPAPVAHRRKTRELSAWMIAAAAVLAALALAILHFGSSPPEVPVVRFNVAPSPGTLFGPGNSAIRPFPEISPDGKWLAFLAQENNEPAMLWVRSLDNTEAHALHGTENAQLPFWSPDSQKIGFFADGKIKRVPASGGQVQVIYDGIRSAPQSSWGIGGTILFFKENGLYSVHETGGIAVQVTSIDRERNEVHRAPFFLPDGKHFLYQEQTPDVPSVIYVGSLEPNESRIRLPIESDSRAVYASPGYLLFVRGPNLFAQPFDVKKLKVAGTPFNVASNVVSNVANGRATFSVSNNGTLVYREGATVRSLPRHVIWIDRSGNQNDSIKNQTGDNVNPRLSPDLKQLMVERRPMRGCDSCSDLWIIGLERNTNTPLTKGPGDEILGFWSVDGNTVYYRANPNGLFDVYKKSATGLVKEELLLKLERGIAQVNDRSDDGKYILFTVNDPMNGTEIWYLPLVGEAKAQRLMQVPAYAGSVRFSNDGHWVAYESNKSGINQIYVVPFPSASHEIPISVDGGINPRWRQDGKELLFVREKDRSLMHVGIRISGSKLEPEIPTTLFHYPEGDPNFAMTPDANRFVWSVTQAPLRKPDRTEDSPLTIVLNWTADLKR